VRVAGMANRLGMRHVVVTSVTRDDLPDGGAAHYAEVACALHPDFRGDVEAVSLVARSPYSVLAHNVETVPRLYPAARPEADYERSLRVLETLARSAPGKLVKSGLMLGLGETPSEVRLVLRDLRRVGVDVMAIGQYLQPTADELPVNRFTPQAEFDDWAEEARGMGFGFVTAGPYVRSSYRAGDAVQGSAPAAPTRSRCCSGINNSKETHL
jgi:lipoic acid synthetase